MEPRSVSMEDIAVVDGARRFSNHGWTKQLRMLDKNFMELTQEVMVKEDPFPS